MGVLIAARVAQGAFAATVTPASMALVRHTYDDPTKRARAVSIWSMGGGIAAVCGPLLGGLLTALDWRLIFIVNIPVAAAILILLRGARPSPTRQVRFDWAGQITGLLAIGGLVFAAIEAGAAGFTSRPVILASSVTVLAAVGFWLVQRHVAHPMVPLPIFRSRTVVISVATGFTFMVGFYGQPFVFSIFLQQERGLTAGFINPPVSAVLLNHVEAHLAGTASGIYNTSRQVGGALAIAAFGALLASSSGLLTGMRTSMIVAAALILVTACAGVMLRTSDEQRMPQTVQPGA